MRARAQIEVTFNWIYILVAGAIILLFFAGIVVKQKSASEEYLASDVVQIMGTIFTGAGVSEKTKNFIDTSGLSDYTFYFDCQEGVGEYGIEGRSAKIQNSIDPIFSPRHFKTPQIITWSLPYLLPFKVTDFLYVTSPNSIYYFYGFGDVADELEKQTEEFSNVRRLVDLEDYESLDPGQVFQLRIVDLSGTLVPNSNVPGPWKALDDEKVSAVVIQGDMVDYYQKRGNAWEKTNPSPLSVVSLGGERDAAKFAAIFAGSPEMYQCNMQKAFHRLRFVTDLYLARAEELEAYYLQRNPTGECMAMLSSTDNNVKVVLQSMITELTVCELGEECHLLEKAQLLVDLNHRLSLNCIPLY